MGNLLTTRFESADRLEEAERLRAEALALQKQAKEASDKSQYEYQFGSRSEAKTLSNEKTRLYEEMNRKNTQAATLIFFHHNSHQPETTIDLHGLYVSEAVKYLEDRVNQCRAKKIPQLTVITGAGNNSMNRIPKIKPEVEAFARKHQLKVTSYSGHLIFDLSTNEPGKLDGCILF